MDHQATIELCHEILKIRGEDRDNRVRMIRNRKWYPSGSSYTSTSLSNKARTNVINLFTAIEIKSSTIIVTTAVIHEQPASILASTPSSSPPSPSSSSSPPSPAPSLLPIQPPLPQQSLSLTPPVPASFTPQPQRGVKRLYEEEVESKSVYSIKSYNLDDIAVMRQQLDAECAQLTIPQKISQPPVIIIFHDAEITTKMEPASSPLPPTEEQVMTTNTTTTTTTTTTVFDTHSKSDMLLMSPKVQEVLENLLNIKEAVKNIPI
ncbi:UV excision repair protein RAD23 homolog B-like [Cephus cinctus]|uniref:UV excision repair protein RAD23 homolog B-like n=1 Tax=Cephus cinctus TaxID=211228 RepID=A0AAJ7RCC0_CEPCN|nr:UV excision repair protein RAD23 homolog B-like [Cephus cinctus]